MVMRKPQGTYNVRTLFVSGLPMDAKPRELYLLFRAYEGYEGSLLKVTSKNGKTASQSAQLAFLLLPFSESHILWRHVSKCGNQDRHLLWQLWKRATLKTTKSFSNLSHLKNFRNHFTNPVGFVTFQTRAGAEAAKQDLQGTDDKPLYKLPEQLGVFPRFLKCVIWLPCSGCISRCIYQLLALLVHKLPMSLVIFWQSTTTSKLNDRLLASTAPLNYFPPDALSTVPSIWATQQGVRFDPDMPQTIRLEFAKSNTKGKKVNINNNQNYEYQYIDILHQGAKGGMQEQYLSMVPYLSLSKYPSNQYLSHSGLHYAALAASSLIFEQRLPKQHSVNSNQLAIYQLAKVKSLQLLAALLYQLADSCYSSIV
ncbi:hypothetical protein ACFE04_000076 [Oxalis oulophora]